MGSQDAKLGYSFSFLFSFLPVFTSYAYTLQS